MRRAPWLPLAVLVLVACGSPSVPDGGGAGGAGGEGGAGGGGGSGGSGGGAPDDRYLNVLETPEDLASLAAEGGDVKYLFRVDGKEPPAPLEARCYFQDMRRFAWHLEFLRSFPELATLSTEAYEALVLRGGRSLWGGAVRPFPTARHPRTGKTGVLGYTVYAGRPPADGLDVDAVAEVDGHAKACVPFAGDLLVYVPSDADQERLVAERRGELEARGVSIVLPRDLEPGVPFSAYSEGEGYGTLRVVPRGEPLGTYGPRDVVVVENAPTDIRIVSGLVSASPQNLHSHVNLRLQEKGIPNASVPAIYDSALVAALDGHLVHLVVSSAGVTLEAARLEDAEAYWDAHRPPVGEVRSDLTVTELRPLSELSLEDADAYGTKAANLGELNAILPAGTRPDGFAIPFARFRDHLVAAGIDAEVEAALADPRLRTDHAFQEATLKALRRRIREAPLAAGLLDELRAAAEAELGPSAVTTKLRFRSSTNAEDLETATGAGLYDSKSGCLADDLDDDLAGPSACLSAEERAHKEAQLAARREELVAHPERTWVADMIAELEEDLAEEKPVSRALPRVWASLWNDAAFAEREYYGLDHREVFMGVAVNPSFAMEQANAVALTNLDGGGGDPVYRVVSQAGELSVVEPEDPTAVAEVVTFRRSGDEATDVRRLVDSNQLPPGEAVWSDEQLRSLAALLFLVQDHFEASVYPTRRPLRLDVEVKRTADGRIELKQARPYVTAGP